jgi:hypothetical protein
MDISVEIEAIRDNLKADPQIIYVSKNQVGGLAGLMKQCLVDPSRDNRIAVLAYLLGDVMLEIAGVNVTSTTNLTSPVASFLINMFRDKDSDKWRPNAYARELIGEIEKRVAARA